MKKAFFIKDKTGRTGNFTVDESYLRFLEENLEDTQDWSDEELSVFREDTELDDSWENNEMTISVVEVEKTSCFNNRNGAILKETYSPTITISKSLAEEILSAMYFNISPYEGEDEVAKPAWITDLERAYIKFKIACYEG
jgi:hypothetical protein